MLCDRPFWAETLMLAAPVALQNLLTSSFSLVDTLMVGQLGDRTLSAVGMAGQWSWLMNMLLFGVCSGSSVLISQFWGVGDKRHIRSAIGITLLVGLAATLLFFLPALLIPGFVLRLFTGEAEVLTIAQSYLQIASLSYPAVVLSNILSVSLRATEDVKTPLYICVLTAFANIVLNYMFIFGHFGMPRLGVAGAALATCISSWLGPLLLIPVSVLRKNILAAPPRSFFAIAKDDLSLYARRVTPAVINEFMWGLGTFCFTLIFSNLGYENYAAVTIFRTFESIAFVIFIGMCNACAIMVGKRVGNGEIAKAVLFARRFALLEPLTAVAIGMVIILLRVPLVSLFNLGQSISAYTAAVAAQLLMIYGFEIPLRNLPYIQIAGILRAGGDTKTGLKFDLSSLWLCSLPLTLCAAFVLKLPFVGVFLVMYLAEDIPKAFFCTRYFLSNRWLRPVTEEGRRGLAAWQAETKN